MSVRHWLAALLVVTSAVALATWSGRSRRARQRAVIGQPTRPGRIRHGTTWWALTGRRQSGVDEAGGRWQGLPGPEWIAAWPWRATLGGAVLAALAGAVAGGPVAGLVAAVYGGLAVRAAIGRFTGRARERDRRRKLDSLGALAADLRAGLPVPAALAVLPTPTVLAPQSVSLSAIPAQLGAAAAADQAFPTGGVTTGNDRIIALTRAAVRLAEQTGAPLADLVERIEADTRMMDRGLAAAAAQAAGARATAWLLAGLPLGGIALGYGIGVDPLHVLLRTPIGAACAVGALVLQLAGLAWADRLSSGPARGV